jgi:hypothetical protein
VEMEADREEEIKIIERVIIWSHFIMEWTVPESNTAHTVVHESVHRLFLRLVWTNVICHSYRPLCVQYKI